MNKARWEPEKLLANKAYELLKSLKLEKKETIYLIIDDSKKNKRGKDMDAVGWVHDPLSGKSIWGHQGSDICSRHHYSVCHTTIC